MGIEMGCRWKWDWDEDGEQDPPNPTGPLEGPQVPFPMMRDGQQDFGLELRTSSMVLDGGDHHHTSMWPSRGTCGKGTPPSITWGCC